MKSFLVYDLNDHYLGEVLADNVQDAVVLAREIFPQPHRVLTFRLTFNLRPAA